MSTESSRKIFVNLAVENLDNAVGFFTQLGFSFDPRFTDEQATCMIVSDEAFVMLLAKDRFRGFTKKKLCDSTTHTEAILAVSADSREQVDELVRKALAAGGAAGQRSYGSRLHVRLELPGPRRSLLGGLLDGPKRTARRSRRGERRRGRLTGEEGQPAALHRMRLLEPRSGDCSPGNYDLPMAICAVCGQEMLTASSCTERLAELVDGRYERIRWGALEGEPTDESCGDCGVDPGGLHHAGCEFETCPRCGEALALCDCWPE